MKYNVDDKLKPKELTLYGLQWFSVVLPSLIILTSIASLFHANDISAQLFYSQKIFFLAGVALVVQVRWGHRLPVLSGPASVLLIGLLNSHNTSTNAIYTAIAIGGALTVLLSYGRFFGYLQKIFTTRVIIVILILVAVTLLPMIIRLSSGSDENTYKNIAFSVCLAIVLAYTNHLLRGIYKSIVVLAGLIAGTLAYFLINGFPILYKPEFVQLTEIKDNLFISPEFDFAAILAFLFCFLALTVNEIGAVQATGRLISADRLEIRSKKGLRFTGLFNIFSGAFGVLGMVDFSMSPGIISATRCASRYPVFVTGILLILCALIPHTLWLFTFIPEVVMGSMMLYIMSAQLSSGLQLMSLENAVVSFENAMTISIPIMIGLFISFAPESYVQTIPTILQPLLGNGFVLGTIAVLFLEHTLNNEKKKNSQV